MIAFEAFWSVWQHKSGRQKAELAWTRLSDADRQLAIDGIAPLVATRKWREGYKMLPTTYLHGRRWEDEHPAAPVDPKVQQRLGPAYQELGGLEFAGPEDETYAQCRARFEAELPELAKLIGPPDKVVPW